MSSFCPNCGTKIDQGFKFCLNCGAKLNINNTNDSSISKKEIEQTSDLKQSNSKEIINPKTQPAKLNKKLLTSIIGIIAIVILIIILIILVGGGLDGHLDSRFVGVWEQSDGDNFTFDWTFKSDGIFEIMSMDLATWKVKDNRLCFETNDFWHGYIPEGSFDEVCYNFKFSDGGKTLSLSINGSENILLKKK